MRLEELPELLKSKELTMSEIQEQLSDCSVMEISRFLMTTPEIRQVYGVLCDGKVRFTASSNR